LSVTVSIKVHKKLVELADKMVRLGLARSRSHAFNLMIKRGLAGILEEVRLWEEASIEAEEMLKRGYRIRHGGLTRILEGDRER